MTQPTQNLKTEIISALDTLPVDSLKLLAKFVSFLQADVTQEGTDTMDFETHVEIPQRTVRISSPRLADPEQAADFRKEVVWDVTNDSL